MWSRVKPDELSGRLARKLLSLLVFAAFVPLAIAAGVGYWQASDTLFSRSESLQESQAVHQANLWMNHLQILAETLRLAVTDAQREIRRPAMQFSEGFPFYALKRVKPEELQGWLAPMGIAEARFVRHIESGRAALLFDQDGKYVMAIRSHDRRVWTAHIRPEQMTNLGRGGSRLVTFCWRTNPLVAPRCDHDRGHADYLAGVLGTDPPATRRFSREDAVPPTDFIAVRVPLAQSFLVHDAWVVVAQPRNDLMTLLAELHTAWIMIVILVFSFVLLLCSLQMRMMLVPLNALLSGMQRFARQDFSTPIRVSAQDEFATLASHFNGMGERLSRKFDTVERLAGIDRLILRDPDILQVTERVLDGLAVVFPGHTLRVCLRLNITSTEWLTGHRAPGTESSVSWSPVPASAHELTVLADRDVVSLEDSGPLRDRLATLFATPLQGFWTIAPMRVGDDVLGGILVSCVALSEEHRGLMREYADRLAVATVNADRAGRLYRQAHYDELTGLPNRQLMRDRLKWAIASAHRHDRRIALIFVDIDDFKKVNDSAGHGVGDALLQKTAERMRVCVREGDTVARLGGDEFVIILPFLPDDARAQRVAERIVHMISSPFMIEGREFYVGASVGIAICPADGTTEEALLMSADMAMYRAKQAGKNQYRFFEEQMQAVSQARAMVEKDIRIGLREDQFSLHFQPQWNVREAQWSVEALVRWNRPGHGIVSPGEFIDVAEETGLILDIGDIVLEKACRQILLWSEAGVPVCRVAVNVSGRQLMRADFIERLWGILHKTAFPPAMLEIELTESVLLQDIALAVDKLNALRHLGIRLAIDDFGTGYSSLSYVQQLPIHTLKIDRSFISPLPAEESSVSIVRAIIQMAHALGREVVAEGVETEAQADALLAMSCESLQGYYLSRPLAPEACERFLCENRFRGAGA